MAAGFGVIAAFEPRIRSAMPPIPDRVVTREGRAVLPLAEWLPYSVARTWHTQLGIFWIATAWLATGLYVGPGTEAGAGVSRDARAPGGPLPSVARRGRDA